MTVRKKGITNARKSKPKAAKAGAKHTQKIYQHVGREKISMSFPVSNQISNIEEILATNISSQATNQKNSNLPLLPDILYNMTPSTRNLGYNSGFAVGVKIFERSSAQNDASPLINALENAGFRHTQYSPLNDTAIITARQSRGINLGDKAHVFESGLIAGYLSAATGKGVNVTENQCIHKQGDFCQFVATESKRSGYETAQSSDLSNVTSMIAQGMMANESGSRISDNFYMLEMLPFTKEPIEKEASRLLYIAGQRVGEQSPKNIDESVKNLASILGVRDIKLFKKKKSGLTSIRLKYKPVNSMSEYINLSTSLVAGMIKGMYNNAPSIVRKITQDGSYTVDLIL